MATEKKLDVNNPLDAVEIIDVLTYDQKLTLTRREGDLLHGAIHTLRTYVEIQMKNQKLATSKKK